MELLHNFLAKPKWEDSAVHRAKQMFLSHYKSLHKSLERETADRIMGAMFGPSRQVLCPSSPYQFYISLLRPSMRLTSLCQYI